MDGVTSRRDERIALGAAAVVTVREAVKRLPISDCDAEAFIRERQLVRSLRGREVVIWGDVLDALRGASSAPMLMPYIDPSVP
jgi:hypothetical protein